MLRQVRRRRREQAPIQAQRARHEQGVVDVADHDAQLVAGAHERLGTIIQRQVDRHVGVRREPACERRRQLPPAESHGSDRAQSAARRSLQLERAGLRERDARQRGATTLEVQLADLGELVAPGGAMEQARAQAPLDRLHLLGHHRRGHARLRRGGREAAAFDDPHECPHARELVHDSKPSGWK